MKIKSLFLTLVLAVVFGVVLPRQAEARVTFSYFYDSLQPYGEWVDVDTYGYCWQPRGMDRDWRPYTDGYWSYTDAGWTWVSYEDFGSITYHYGRWVNLEDYGWVWKPDYEWGPAWVSWRQSDDYIGWAPLPPDAVFEPQTGIGVWVDRDYDIGPSAYSFCEYRYFGAPVLRNFLVPRHRNFAIINNSVNITNITIVTGNDHNRLVFNGGPDYHRVSERSQNRIEMLQLRRQTDGDWAQHHRSELSRRVGNQLVINAPEVDAPKTRFAPAVVTQQIHAPKIDRGWSGASNPAQREQIKQLYHNQTQGMTRATAPATAVDAGQVQTMMNEVRTHQKQVPQPAQVQLPMQVQQPGQTQQLPPTQKDRSRRKDQQPAVVQQPAAVPQPTQAQLPMQVQQPGQTQQLPPMQKDRSRRKDQQPAVVQQPAAVPQPAQVQMPTQVQQPAESQQLPPTQKDRSRRKDQQQGQVIQSLDQPKAQQIQQVDQPRKAAEAEARATRQQQAEAQRAQQSQAQAEQQRRAAEGEARAARQQQAEAQRAQQPRIQVDQPRKAAEPQPRAPRGQPAQAQPQGSPTPDDRKKHRD